MSTSKHIDVICAAALLCALLVTVLFINGKALGLSPLTGGDAGDGDGVFTPNDLDGGWDAAGATRITLTGDGGRVSGSGAYIRGGDVHIICAGKYVLSGELAAGSVIIDAGREDKIWLLLDGVSLHCEDSAAILVEQAKKVFLTLADGTENTVSGGPSWSDDAVSAKIDGVIYSRDDLTINGSGSLSVTAPYKHGIVCNDNLVIAGGTIDITAAQDGVHANDSVSFTEASLTVTAGDDGVTVSNDDETAWLYVESGSISIPSCYEGLEAIDITIAGGVTDIRPTDDGINANGRGGNSVIRITGGEVTIINETGRDADGLDSNGSIYISGGNTFISVNTSSCALDYGSENGGVCKISGGRVVAAGGSFMAEGFDSSSEQCFIMYTTSTADPGAAVTLKNEAGDTLISEAIPCGFSSVVLSTPELQMGETCTISVDGSSAEITVDNSSSGGFGMGGMFGGGSWGGGGAFGGRGGRRGTDSTGAADSQTLNISELSAGDSGRGDMPRRPGGGFGDGDMPQRPSGGFGEGDMPQASGDGFPGESWGDRFTQWGQQAPNQTPDGAADGASAALPDTLLPVGVSVLFLLAGILITFKVKH